jgi:hypothetical protein
MQRRHLARESAGHPREINPKTKQKKATSLSVGGLIVDCQTVR